MKTNYFPHFKFEGAVQEICRQITLSDWKPDYIVGITRGGLIPAVYISQYLDVPMHTLGVSLRNEINDCEHNCWMPEDAFGYVPEGDRESINSRWDPSFRKNILIVDDINDTGATFAWIKQDWQESCLPKNPVWDTVWHHNVKFAVLINNESSTFKTVDFSACSINKADDPQWIVFPWEEWWNGKD
jgi:uncharacterized protein